jgi:hypothetical protein
MEEYPVSEELASDYNDFRLMQMFRWTPEQVENLSMHWRMMIKAALAAQNNDDPDGKKRWWGNG